MLTPEDLHQQHQARLARLAEREQRYLDRRRRMNRNLVITGAAIGGISLLALTWGFAGSYAVPIGLGLVAGAIGGWLMGRTNAGMMIAAVLLAGPLVAVSVMCHLVGLMPMNIKGFFIATPVMGGWPLLGLGLGWWNEQFDEDHSQI